MEPRCLVFAFLGGTVLVLVAAVAVALAVAFGSRVPAAGAPAAESLHGPDDLREFAAGGGATTPAVVLFHTPWCKYCVRMKPQFEAAARELTGAARLAHMDPQEHPEVAKQVGLQGFPTMVAFHPTTGEISASRPGYTGSAGIVRWVRSQS